MRSGLLTKPSHGTARRPSIKLVARSFALISTHSETWHYARDDAPVWRLSQVSLTRQRRLRASETLILESDTP